MPPFSMQDMLRANDEWGANCGPGAIAAIMGMTLDDVRPHMGDFEQKHYTNPTLMWSTLRSIGRHWCKTKPEWPFHGLVRIQWEGPWTAEGVNPKARYRYTHWVGCIRAAATIGIFDINALANGTGWCSLEDWESTAATVRSFNIALLSSHFFHFHLPTINSMVFRIETGKHVLSFLKIQSVQFSYRCF